MDGSRCEQGYTLHIFLYISRQWVRNIMHNEEYIIINSKNVIMFRMSICTYVYAHVIYNSIQNNVNGTYYYAHCTIICSKMKMLFSVKMALKMWISEIILQVTIFITLVSKFHISLLIFSADVPRISLGGTDDWTGRDGVGWDPHQLLIKI